MASVYHSTEGIVLKKTPYGEADFLARFLTRDFGKIDLRLRGARKHNSKLNSHLDLWDHSSISFVKNGDRIPTIIDAEKISPNINLSNAENSLNEASRVSRSLDLLIPFEVKDAKLFFMARDFFLDAANNAENFIYSVILHEGYGKASFLPDNVNELIIREWPTLKN